MEFFFVTEHLAQGYWTNKRIISRECTNYTGGVRENVPPGNFLKIGLSEMPYPAFVGSNVINSYVYLVELFSESRYSWFPRRSTKIHDPQVFKTKILDSYMFCNYDSWFRFYLRNRGNVWMATRKRTSWARFNFNVYAWLSIQYLYFKYARKIYVCSSGKITWQWKSTLTGAGLLREWIS